MVETVGSWARNDGSFTAFCDFSGFSDFFPIPNLFFAESIMLLAHDLSGFEFDAFLFEELEPEPNIELLGAAGAAGAFGALGALGAGAGAGAGFGF